MGRHVEPVIVPIKTTDMQQPAGQNKKPQPPTITELPRKRSFTYILFCTMPHTTDPDATTTNNNDEDTDYNSDDKNVARMEADIISLEQEMDSLEVEILAIQSENLAAKKEIESILQSPANNIGRIEMGLLAVELLALKVLLTTLVKEEIHCKNVLKDRTDQVLTTAYELHALLKRQLVTRRKQLAEAQARLQQASSRSREAARVVAETDTDPTNSTTR
jgi:hypothetical protein